MRDTMGIFKEMMKDVEKSLFFDSDEDIYDIFTEKRFEMIQEICHSNPSSIRELAGNLERDIKNVYDDLSILSRHHIVAFEVIGRRKRPIVKKDMIIIRLR